jgi:hypothetical protein
MSDSPQEISDSETSTGESQEDSNDTPRTLSRNKRQAVDSPDRINVDLNGSEVKEFK